jgi:mRNA interferase HigB
VKDTFRTASIIGRGSDRVVFNIKGNDFRLVVRIDYARQIVDVRWFGTHAEYDRIDALNV